MAGRSDSLIPAVEVHDDDAGLALHGHLGLVMRREPGGRVVGWVPVRPDLAPGGRLPLGTLAFVCDVVGGHVAGLAVVPRWVVTTDVVVHRVGSPVVVGPVRAVGSVVRVGRTSVVVSIDVVDAGDGDRLVAWSSVGSTPLDPAFEPFAARLRDGVVFGSGQEPEAAPPFQEFLGFAPDAGRMVFDMPPLARNPWGMMHGGAVIEALAAAGTSAARERIGGDVVVSSSHTRFVNGAKVGPFEAVAEVLDDSGGSPTGPIRVVMTDRGADRTVALGVIEAAQA